MLIQDKGVLIYRVRMPFYSIRKLPQQKPFQGRMRSILVIAAAF